MNRKPASGYTIIETIIFLAVSSALMASAMAVISGKQDRTRYTQTVATFEQELKDTLNDVSTGYYPNSGNFSCVKESFPAGRNNIKTLNITSPGNKEQGANSECIFLGKAIEFTAGSSAYNAYTMFASEANTSLTGPGSGIIKLLGHSGNLGTLESKQINNNVMVTRVFESPSGPDLRGIGIITEFNKQQPVSSGASGNAAQVRLHGITGTGFDNDMSDNITPTPLSDGAIICLRQDSNGRRSVITIGKGGQQLATKSSVDFTAPGCP
jgi:type II secretory pathway pseudopilin PulG